MWVDTTAAESQLPKGQRVGWQASASGEFFVTFDKHTLMVWSTAHLWSKPLALHHTKPFMVDPPSC